MNNLEIRNYIKGKKKFITNKESTETLLEIKKEIEEFLDSMKLSGATMLFLHNIRKKLNIIIKKSKRQENINLNYFENKDIKSSPAEELIIIALDKIKVKYYREVSFSNFTTNTGHYYRYDFYIPSKNLIIEYDGKAYHNNNLNDVIKNKFCLNNKIKLVRLNAKHYYSLEKELRKILK